jgi:hypothetical protein
MKINVSFWRHLNSVISITIHKASQKVHNLQCLASFPQGNLIPRLNKNDFVTLRYLVESQFEPRLAPSADINMYP